MANNFKKTVIISSGFFGVALLGFLLAFIFLLPAEKPAPSSSPAPSPSPVGIATDLKVVKGGEVTLIGEYNNPESEAFALRLTEAVPAGTEYVSGSLAHDGGPLTDVLDQDIGVYNPAARTLTWDIGNVLPGGTGKISYRVKVTGEMEQMESVTKVILDPGTEDEDEFLSEPLVFYIGQELPLEEKEIIPPASEVPEVGGEEPENFSVARYDGGAMIQGSADLMVETTDGRLLDYSHLTLGLLQGKYLAKITKPLRGILTPATVLIARGGGKDTATLRDRSGGATNSGKIKPDGSCLDLTLKYKPADLVKKNITSYNLFLVWYNAKTRTWERISSNIDIEFTGVVGCVAKLGVYAIGY